ncbi:hypothetical protein CYLTODRAFT_94532 [Cylindrobasidium torrendii FP15055 ss-10]|uniref:C2H2-type domain-containing protein n=1 Tax=Cylindrobasidium torrendii FP15055 ss-10 TaxID=1314674 RepID=A0A0D7BV77_9AGAR|nr:hypothetical protein CYLTODRAFT_94532 [Cylindrobasidium torrendii FP15055 ss-10]
MSLQQSMASYMPSAPMDLSNMQHSSPSFSSIPSNSPLSINTSAPPASAFSPSALSSSSYASTPSLTTAPYSPPSPRDGPISSARSDISEASTKSSSAPTLTSSNSEGNALRPHPCLFPDCGRWFTRSYTRNVHMLTHRRSNDPKPFLCTISGCTEGFSRKHDRLRHEVRQHGRGSNFRCPLCTVSKFYSSQSTLERHMSEKHNEAG